MGLDFGHLYKMRGIVMFKLSPYELKPLQGIISEGVPNVIRRVRGQLFYVGVPLFAGYMIYDWGMKEHARLQRKNPADYVDEK